MKSVGQIQPILVRPAARGRYVLLDGGGRFAAAQDLEWDTITANVVPKGMHSDRERLMVQVAANTARADLHALDILKAVEDLRATEADMSKIAEVIGVSHSHAYGIFNLRKLEPSIRAAWDKQRGLATVKSMIVLSRLDAETQLARWRVMTSEPANSGGKGKKTGESKPRSLSRAKIQDAIETLRGVGYAHLDEAFVRGAVFAFTHVLDPKENPLPDPRNPTEK